MTLVSAGAFAQGKISFQNDSTRLAYYDPSVGGGLGGQLVYGGRMPSGVTLVSDLYMGTSSSSLFLYSSTTFSALGEGKWNSMSVLASANGTTGAPLINGGTTVFVLTQVRDQAFAAPNTLNPTALLPFGTYYGTSAEFQFTLGSGATYPAMWSGTTTWQPGSFNLDSSSYGTGARGAIAVSAVPEPTSLALAGLGIAAGMILRRRK